MTDQREPIDAYLDEMLARLRGSSTDVRRILAETEQHLREAAAAGEARGLDSIEAQRQAIERFGEPRELARRFRRLPGWLPPFPTLAQLAEKLAFLAAVGLIAIGVSGGLNALFGAAFGKSFVAGDMPGVTYTAARCQNFLEYHPEAQTCTQAAVAHHFDEEVWYRVDAGVLGIFAVGAFFVIRRYNRKRFGDARLLPEGFTGIIGAALFGLAAAGLLVLGFGALIMSKPGSGVMLADGAVSAVVFVAFGLALLKTLRERAGALEDSEGADTDA